MKKLLKNILFGVLGIPAVILLGALVLVVMDILGRLADVVFELEQWAFLLLAFTISFLYFFITSRNK